MQTAHSSSTPDIAFSEMATTAPADPEAAAASPLLPWNSKVQKFSALYSLYSDGLRGWGYLLNLLCVLTGAATGEAALACAKMLYGVVTQLVPYLNALLGLCSSPEVFRTAGAASDCTFTGLWMLSTIWQWSA